MLRKMTCIGLLLVCSAVFMNCSVDTGIHEWGNTKTLPSFNRPFNAPPDSNIAMASDFPSQVPGANGHGCPVPNELSLARQVKEADEGRFRQGSELNWIRAENGPQSVSLSDSRWAYMDMVVAELRKKDKRWGYTCVWGNCNDPSTDAIAYWCGQGDPGDSTNVATVDIVTSSHNVAWQTHWSESQQDSTARWIYPRPGSTTPPESTGSSNSGFDPSTFSWDKVTFLNGGGLANQNISGWSETSKIVSFSMASQKGICIDHTQKNNWKDEFTHDGETWITQGNPWVFVYKDGKIYAATYEHLRPIGHNHGRGHGQVCKLGHLGSLKEILAGIGSHAKLSPVKGWMPKPGEIVGFAVSTHARYGYKLTQERSDIVWVRIPDYNSVDSGGEIVGRTSGGSTISDTDDDTSPENNTDPQKGQCSNTPNTCVNGVFHSHPKDTLTEYKWTCRNIPHSTGEIPCKAPRTVENCSPAPHYIVVNGRCLPSCGALAHAKGVGPEDHQLQPAPTCRTGWTRLGDSKEEAQHGNSVCCKKISSSTTNSTNSTTTTNGNQQLGQCDVPNHKHIVQQVASDYPDLLAKSNNRQNKNWEFLEKAVEELRKTDTKWGFYHRTQHNLQEASLDSIAYYCGTGNGNGSSDLRYVDVIHASIQIQWSDTGHEDRAKPENGYWKYPRISQ